MMSPYQQEFSQYYDNLAFQEYGQYSLETNACLDYPQVNHEIENFDFLSRKLPPNEYGMSQSIQAQETNHEMTYGQESADCLEANIVSGLMQNYTDVGSNPRPDSNTGLEIVWTIDGNNNIPNSITNAPDIIQTVESLQHYGNKGQETADTFKAATLQQNYSNVANLRLPHSKTTSPLMSSQFNHRESDSWLENCDTTEGNYMPQGKALVNESREFKARNSGLSIENLMPDARAKTDRLEPCTTFSHKRKRQEKETHFEIQPTEIQNNNISIRQAIFGNIPNSITDHTDMEAQPSLESILNMPLNFENMMLLFKNLIALPLEDLTDPEKESCMKYALSFLCQDENYALLPPEKVEQILALSCEFPTHVHNRRHIQYLLCSQQSFAETENINKDLGVTSLKDEENLEVRDGELENKEKELKTQLDAVRKEKKEIAEQIKAAHRNKNERF